MSPNSLNSSGVRPVPTIILGFGTTKSSLGFLAGPLAGAYLAGPFLAGATFLAGAFLAGTFATTFLAGAFAAPFAGLAAAPLPIFILMNSGSKSESRIIYLSLLFWRRYLVALSAITF